MKVSLQWIRDYVDLPADLTAEQLASDLTLRTVEVEAIENPADRVEGIIVGQIDTVSEHPKADRLRVCTVDIGRDRHYQIVCGGSNLYDGELVAVAPPGSWVRWHGEGEPVELTSTKLRGVLSEGMICGSDEICLEALLPKHSEAEIVDLTALFPDAAPGAPIADVLGLDDLIIEIDNKSMTNRPDLWGHYGIARELAAIYGTALKPLPAFTCPEHVDDYAVRIEAPERCLRYDAVIFEPVQLKPAPFWMQRRIWSVGMRPINALVDITNYVMLATGQPTHGFDRAHVERGISVREARAGEQLTLLDGHVLDLDPSDLLICDIAGKPIGLAGVMGGAADSILPETEGLVLEIANFTPKSIRLTAGRHMIRTEASARFEKSLDTQRCDDALGLAQALFAEIVPEAKIVATGRSHIRTTAPIEIPVSLRFLNVRSGHTLTWDDVKEVLIPLGFDVTFDGDDTLTVGVPSWRATGDVDIRDDILEEVCRMIGYDAFDFVPPTVQLASAVRQRDVEAERALREYLAFRAGLQEVFGYPWAADLFRHLVGEDDAQCIRLATPPAPDRACLRASILSGLLEAVAENSRYYEAFGLFELAQVHRAGETHPSTPEETLPIQRRHLGMAVAGPSADDLFRKMKGILAAAPRFAGVRPLTFDVVGERPVWADRNAWLAILGEDDTVIGHMGIASPKTIAESGTRNVCVAMAELDVECLTPLASRDNRFEHVPQFPLVEQDLSIVVDEDKTWGEIEAAIEGYVRRSEFVEAYRGDQVPAGKKSIMFRFWLGSDEGTLSAEAIERERMRLIKKLHYTQGAEMR